MRDNTIINKLYKQLEISKIFGDLNLIKKSIKKTYNDYLKVNLQIQHKVNTQCASYIRTFSEKVIHIFIIAH